MLSLKDTEEIIYLTWLYQEQVGLRVRVKYNLLLDKVALWISVASLSLAGQVISGYWDVFSHRVIFREKDPALNPAHISLYLSFLMMFISIIKTYGAIVKIGGYGNPFIKLLRIALIGAILQIVGGIWNELYHMLVSADEPAFFSPHEFVTLMILIVAIVTVKLTCLTYYTVKRRSLTLPILASFLSLWLIIAGIAMYVGDANAKSGGYTLASIIIAFIAPYTWIALRRIVNKFGYVSLLGLSYTLVNYMFLMVYGGAKHVPILGSFPEIPLGFVIAIASDSMLSLLLRINWLIRSLSIGTVSGSLFMITYYPYTPWIFSIEFTYGKIALLVFTTIAGALGGVFGLRLGNSLIRSYQQHEELS